jgi:hypothetical protein
MNLYDATVPVFQHFLGNLDKWMEKWKGHADSKKFDPEVIVGFRFYPDMAPFSAQIQFGCDQVKYTVAKLAGKEAPSHPDTEKTVEELRARIKQVSDYCGTFARADFEGSGERRVRHGWMPEGKTMRGGDYLDYLALPNFHFHLTNAYSMLRHNGLDLGKWDLLAGMPLA